MPTAAPAGEAVGRAILRDLDVAETLTALQDQFEGLTLGIPDVRTDELPLRLQWHCYTVICHRFSPSLLPLSRTLEDSFRDL